MLKGISNTVGSIPVSIFCLATGAFAGRTFCRAGACKISAKIACLMGNKEASDEWDQVSNHFWKQAKKTAFRDLTAAAGLLAIGVASKYALDTLLPEEEAKEKIEIDLMNNDFMPKFAFACLNLGFIWHKRIELLRSCQTFLWKRRDAVETVLKTLKIENKSQVSKGQSNHFNLLRIQDKTEDLQWWTNRIICLQNIQDAVI